MKHIAYLAKGFVVFSYAMELPQSDDKLAPLMPYISTQRKTALETFRTHFSIPEARWISFISIIKTFYDQMQKPLSQKDICEWEKIELEQCNQGLLHNSISPSLHTICTTIIKAFAQRKCAPFRFRIDTITAPDKSIQSTEEIIYEHSVAGRCRIDELEHNLTSLERRVIIQVNEQELGRFAQQFIQLAAEHEVGHYVQIDCITSSLLHDLVQEAGFSDEQTFQSPVWLELKELMEHEADNFMINSDPQRKSWAQKYRIKPGHWNFNLELLLFDACDNNKEDRVSQLIEDGAMLNAHAASNRNTALHIAAFKGNTAIAQRLLAANANVEAINSQYETPLHIACLHGNTALVKLFVEKYNANPNAKKISNITPLMLAAHQGNIESIDILLKAGANRNDRASNNARAHQFAHDNSQHEAANRLKAEMGISEWWHRIWD